VAQSIRSSGESYLIKPGGSVDRTEVYVQKRYSYFRSSVKQLNIFHFSVLELPFYLCFGTEFELGPRFHALQLEAAFFIG
jgi:hypothetical protein